ncbi:MAG: hypothetical protein HC857_09990 [Synechococcales cyanobacterium RU_4_20]|nr:hypothetical protein [Synechococcales cyanobacterium RU_4_20]NKB16863.1 hypothetical protein [Pseudanabaena sp. CRU_2_10]
MNDWFESTLRTLDQLAEQMGDRLLNLVEQALTVTDTAIDQLSDHLNQAISPELVETVEQQLKAVDQTVDLAMANTERVLEKTFRPVGQTFTPIVNRHDACIGCRNYEGSDFGGNMLVCGFHPYGCQQEKCPDWESTWED